MSEAHRTQVLNAAAEAVNKDRNTDYGEPEDNFKDIAGLWNAYTDMFENEDGESLWNRTDVACFMILTKIARLRNSPTVLDHWTDIAGYAACGYDAALSDATEQEHPAAVSPASPSWPLIKMGSNTWTTFNDRHGVSL